MVNKYDWVYKYDDPPRRFLIRGHTLGCWRFKIRKWIAYRRYVRRWPQFCRKCGAAGEIGGYYDPSPAGVSLSPGRMWDADPCECTEAGRCPRCAKPVFTEDDWTDDENVICPLCGWRYGESDDTAPIPPWSDDCGCWEHRPWTLRHFLRRKRRNR